MKRQFAFAWMASGLALMLLPFSVFLKTSASNSISKAVAPEFARLGDRATVHAVGLGAPRINLADGRELLTAYAGDPEAQWLLQQNLAQPLAIASSDFDEDGVPDLVTGYAAPNGGVLTLHRGNVDSIYPNTLEAQQRRAAGTFTDAPFLSPARAVETPRPGDFIGCGDFDADGHLDVVTAARGSRALYFFLGDGHGNLSAARQIELSGSVTTLITGEINRADGLADIVRTSTASMWPSMTNLKQLFRRAWLDPSEFRPANTGCCFRRQARNASGRRKLKPARAIRSRSTLPSAKAGWPTIR
ncbi:MAG: VCBS repeat-containing protein [Acidobacteriota bacterium]